MLDGRMVFTPGATPELCTYTGRGHYDDLLTGLIDPTVLIDPTALASPGGYVRRWIPARFGGGWPSTEVTGRAA